MILHKEKILFIHIPRTGGSSVEKYFSFSGDSNLKKIDTAQHVTLKEYCDSYENLDEYYKFSIVRNPWDRLVSWYIWSYAEVLYYQFLAENGKYYPTDCNSRSKAWIKGKNFLSDESNNYLDTKMFLKFKTSFSNFLDKIESEDLSVNQVHDNVFDINNRLKSRWIMPQVKWLENESKIKCDYILKYELLQRNFKLLLKKLKRPCEKLETVGAIVKKPHYRKFYTKKNQEIVSRVYKEDIKKFKYEF